MNKALGWNLFEDSSDSTGEEFEIKLTRDVEMGKVQRVKEFVMEKDEPD